MIFFKFSGCSSVVSGKVCRPKTSKRPMSCWCGISSVKYELYTTRKCCWQSGIAWPSSMFYVTRTVQLIIWSRSTRVPPSMKTVFHWERKRRPDRKQKRSFRPRKLSGRPSSKNWPVNSQPSKNSTVKVNRAIDWTRNVFFGGIFLKFEISTESKKLGGDFCTKRTHSNHENPRKTILEIKIFS